MVWDGMGWDAMGWDDGMGWDWIGWDGMGSDWMQEFVPGDGQLVMDSDPDTWQSFTFELVRWVPLHRTSTGTSTGTSTLALALGCACVCERESGEGAWMHVSCPLPPPDRKSVV